MTRQGRQTPTQSVILPYKSTKGLEAVDLYNSTGRTALEWQELLIADIMAQNDDGLWTHQKFGYSVPRRNGKNEIIAMREMWGLVNGEIMCHTAHRTTTSSSAWKRLVKLLTSAGYVELGRKKKDETPPEKSFRCNKQHGLENIVLTNGGQIDFRTRTPNGGLGEGFDLLVIDEAQEYTDDQQDALIYTVSDSKNPQTIFCGTPPTATSSGTVFQHMRSDCLSGDSYETGWAEWSIPKQTDDVFNTELWYETNPSMGAHLDERKIRSEIKPKENTDFNIQRLGVWLTYNQASEVSEAEWMALKPDKLPDLKGQLFVGIKFGGDGQNVSMSIACRTTDGKIFVEAVDCQSIRKGNGWMIRFLKAADVRMVVIDGKTGTDLFLDECRENKIKPIPQMIRVSEICTSSTMFIQALENQSICHMAQPSLVQSVCNCERRAIGGGFGFKSQKEGVDVSLMESMVMAHWICAVTKERRKQKVRF